MSRAQQQVLEVTEVLVSDVLVALVAPPFAQQFSCCVCVHILCVFTSLRLPVPIENTAGCAAANVTAAAAAAAAGRPKVAARLGAAAAVSSHSRAASFSKSEQFVAGAAQLDSDLRLSPVNDRGMMLSPVSGCTKLTEGIAMAPCNAAPRHSTSSCRRAVRPPAGGVVRGSRKSISETQNL